MTTINLLSLPHTLNPAFEGSYDVGGADADLIVDGALLEIKTTVRPEINLNWIRQLLGYVLLDYSDSHQIKAIGLYMARQGILFQWELEDAIQRLSGDILADIRVLRERFRDLARRSEPPASLIPLRQTAIIFPNLADGRISS